jgi:glyoxylase-like metal-dependent hydrolase (beta-lactamase superfamily II)
VSQSTTLEIVTIPAGPIATNAFLVIDPDTRQALVIDAPPDLLDALHAEIARRQATPIALVITHGHGDHIGDAAAVARRYSIPILMHDLDRPHLETPEPDSWIAVEPARVDRVLADGDDVQLGRHRFRVLHTPGHIPGQISLYSPDNRVMFGGDTLFPNGYGRVDIPGASEEQTVTSMKRLLELPDDVVVYTGHGEPTTIGRERPWMEQVARSGQLL